MALITLEITLDDALTGGIVVNEKTGERWVCLDKLSGPAIYQNANKKKTNLKLCLADRKELTQYGETHTLYLNQSKEEREASTPKRYVGGGKVASTQTTPGAAGVPTNTAPSGDLPF